MNKNKLITFIIIILVLLNLGTLGFMFFKGSKEKLKPREIIIEKLHFNHNQIVEYDKVIKIHQKTIRNLDDSIRETKKELYQLLNSENNINVKKDSLIQRLSSFQLHIETTHFNHFVEIKKLCNKEKLADYEDLTEELSKLFSHRPKSKND